ncbi:MAG: ABC-2 transporter permease, partial [Wujia sp.]
MMAGLIEKDIRILLRRKQALFLFFALAVVLGYTQGGTFILGYLPLLIMLLAMGTIAYDELDNGYTFLFTLPIDVKTYVRE